MNGSLSGSEHKSSFPAGTELPRVEVLPGEHEKGKSGEGGEDGEEGGRETWHQIWYDFSQNTTLHGLRLITEDTPFFVRRIVWVIFVLGGISLFLFMLSLNWIAYLGYPVNVNIKINYNKSLIFPAITICNQNSFRATAASEIGKYSLVRDYYSNLHHGGVDLEDYGAHNLSLQYFYDETSHQASDFIVSCMWDQNQECSPEGDFIPVKTDYGYCYTFNGPDRPGGPLVVSKTGVDRGLKLTLNVEQYEYLGGPNHGSGIKILLHDQNEVPLVGGFGQAVPPGSYAYISSQIKAVKNIPPPHGICDDETALYYYDNYSVSGCKMECKTNHTVQQCGCRDVYMPSKNDHNPVCDLDTYQSCYLDSIGSFDGDECDCPVPCSQLLFSSSLSYAGVSEMDVGYFQQQSDPAALEERHRAARDVRAFEEETTRSQDTRLLRKFVRHYMEVNKTLNIHKKRYLEDSLATITDINDELVVRASFHGNQGFGVLKSIVEDQFLRRFLIWEERTFSRVTSNCNEIVSFIEENFLIFANASRPLEERDFLFRYARAELYRVRVAGEKAMETMGRVGEIYQGSGRQKNSTSPGAGGQGEEQYTPGGRYDAAYLTEQLTGTPDQQEEMAEYAERYLQEVAGYLEDIQRADMLLQEAFVTGEGGFSNGTESPGKAGSMGRALEGMVKWADSIDRTLYRVKRLAELPREVSAEGEAGFLGAQTHLSVQFLDTASHLSGILARLRTTQNLPSIQRFSEHAQDYIRGAGRKSQLAADMFSPGMAKDMLYLEELAESMATDIQTVTTKLTSLRTTFREFYSYMREEALLSGLYAQIRDDVIALQNATSGEHADLMAIIAEFTGRSTAYVITNTTTIYRETNADFVDISEGGDIVRNLTQITEQLEQLAGFSELSELIHVEERLSRQLKAYQDSIELDRQFFMDNFIQVLVFVSQLDYEEIEQQKAYSMPNLWSDIGGSMGLCIGASLITVFELLDTLIHTMCKLYCRARKRS